MSKENNCHCVVCQVERDLLDSLSTQTARIHFHALASNYPILKDFDSPAGVIARLHEHEEIEVSNHKAWNGILHSLVDSIADGTAEEIGQQLLLVAYAPAVHKVHREVCQKFPGLSPDDVAQQAALCFLETARSPEMRGLNGHLPSALAVRFRRRLFRWAMAELRQLLPLDQAPAEVAASPTAGFEHAVTLEKLLQQAKRDGLLAEAEYQLLLKLKHEGFAVKELAEACGMTSEDFSRRFHRRLQTIIGRLRRVIGQNDRAQQVDSAQSKKTFKKITLEAVNFSGEMGIRESVEGFSPELSHDVPRFEQDIPPIAA